MFDCDMLDLITLRLDKYLFTVVDVRGAGTAILDVIVKSPSGKTVPHQSKLIGSCHHVTYTPRERGEHKIHLSYGGTPIKGKI